MLAMLAAAGMLIFPKPAQAICAFQQGLNSMTTLASGNNLYVLWESSSGFESGSNVGNYTLFFKTSNDGGKTFEKTIRIHSATLLPCTFSSQMAIGGNGQGGNNIYVMWQDGKVYFKASTDGGSSFGDTISLGEGTLGSLMGPSFVPWGGQTIAGVNNDVYMAWVVSNQITHHGDMRFISSDNGGKSFSNVKNFSNPIEDHQEPQLALSGQNVYLAWTEYACDGCGDAVQPPWCGNAGITPTYTCQTKIMLAKSSDGGKNFGSTLSLVEGNSVFANGDTNVTASDGHPSCAHYFYCGLPHQPRIKAAGSNVYVSWFYGPHELYFTRSSDNGGTFRTPARLSEQVSENESSSVYYSSPFISTIDNVSNEAYAGWVVNSDYAGSSLYLVRSADGGNQFENVTSAIPQGFGDFPASISKRLVITKNDALYFAWSSGSDSNRILFEAVRANQTTASNPFVIYSFSNARMPIYLWQPAVAATDSGKVYVIWQNAIDQYVKGLIQPELLIRSSTDGGQTFGSTKQFQEVVMVPEFSTSITFIIATISAASVVIASRHYLLKKK